jgi:aspartyl aminopeptidase
MTHLLEDLRSFLDSAPTSWHAVWELGNRFAAKDFIPLGEDETWELEFGKKYFVKREGALIAFTLPLSKPKSASILASHTDSPGLKIKPNPENEKENLSFFGVEIYGAPLLSSWLNRDLGIAGRVIVSTKEGNLEERLIFIDDAPLIIPQLSIHLDREVNEKGLQLNRQEHLCPIGRLKKAEGKNYLETLIRRYHSFHALISFDLFLVPLEESRFLGEEAEMIASYRIDNLASAHACAAAIASAAPSQEALHMAVFFDHEEIGSHTQDGASSPFFLDLLQRICLKYPLSNEDLLKLKSRSLCISVDMAQGFTPGHSNKYDPQHQPLLGKGIAIKYNANQRYATTASSAAPLIQLCQQLQLPVQTYVTRNDLPCGSTVGPLFAALTGIATADIGAPQLSMHSIREIMAVSDHLDMCQLLTAFLEEK